MAALHNRIREPSNLFGDLHQGLITLSGGQGTKGNARIPNSRNPVEGCVCMHTRARGHPIHRLGCQTSLKHRQDLVDQVVIGQEMGAHQNEGHTGLRQALLVDPFLAVHHFMGIIDGEAFHPFRMAEQGFQPGRPISILGHIEKKQGGFFRSCHRQPQQTRSVPLSLRAVNEPKMAHQFCFLCGYGSRWEGER